MELVRLELALMHLLVVVLMQKLVTTMLMQFMTTVHVQSLMIVEFVAVTVFLKALVIVTATFLTL